MAATGSKFVEVRWVEDGKFQGVCNLIERKYVMNNNNNNLKEGEEVEVRWGKKGRLWKAVYLGDHSQSDPSDPSEPGKSKKKKSDPVSQQYVQSTNVPSLMLYYMHIYIHIL